MDDKNYTSRRTLNKSVLKCVVPYHKKKIPSKLPMKNKTQRLSLIHAVLMQIPVIRGSRMSA
jgi:hypothetical protein